MGERGIIFDAAIIFDAFFTEGFSEHDLFLFLTL